MRSLLLLICTIVSAQARAQLCSSWGPSQKVGTLDTRLLPEDSGLAISRQYPDRLYHMNDGNNDPVVYVTDSTGRIQQQLPILGLPADFDTEEIGTGPCAGQTCIFVGDIGDNKARRGSIGLYWFVEEDRYHGPPSLSSLELTYPDHPHDAEAFFTATNGDIYLFTKEGGQSTVGGTKKQALPSQIYRIPAEQIQPGHHAFKLQHVGRVDTAALLPDEKRKKQTVTAAAISQDGTRILLLTDSAVFEISWSAMFTTPQKNWQQGKDYNVLAIDMPQPEGIDFFPDASAFIVTTESKGKGQGKAPIVEVVCQKK